MYAESLQNQQAPLFLDEELNITNEELIFDMNIDRDCVTSVQFGQNDLPYNITSPGQYCLNESVMVNNAMPVAIMINSSNVSLNLNGNMIMGTGGTTGILVNAQSNIAIFNGSITTMLGSGIYINPLTQMLLIDSVTTVSNLTGITAVGINKAIIKNCSATLSRGTGFAFAQGGAFLCQNCLIDNCFSLNNIGQGFSFNNCFNIRVNNATGNSNQNNGFFQTGGDKVLYTNCTANSNVLNGFSVAGSTGVLNNCFAASNQGTAFLMLGNQYDINNCEANTNSSGFQINGTNISTLNCIAKNNIVNGFIFGTSSLNCQTRSNTSMANGVGFQDNGTTNKFYSNFANANTTDYVGIPNVFTSPTVLSPINFTANIAE